MRTYHIGDPRAEAYLLKVEEMLTEARAFSARRALLRDARPPRRKARVWLGSVLRAVAHRLLRSAPGPASWLAQRPGITAPIASATSVAQLKALAGGIELKLDEDVTKTLDQASAWRDG